MGPSVIGKGPAISILESGLGPRAEAGETLCSNSAGTDTYRAPMKAILTPVSTVWTDPDAAFPETGIRAARNP